MIHPLIVQNFSEMRLFRNTKGYPQPFLILVWWVSSCSESFRLLVWQAKNTTSGQGLSRERSLMGFRFSGLGFLDVPGTATEPVQTCGFRRNPSSLDKAPKMRDSVRLNSWESFLLTLPSISSETWVMYSSAIPGLIVFCDWLFLLFSGVSPENAANSFLFHNVAMILREKLCQLWRRKWFINFVAKYWSPSLWGEKVPTKQKQLMMSKMYYNTKRL